MFPSVALSLLQETSSPEKKIYHLGLIVFDVEIDTIPMDFPKKKSQNFFFLFNIKKKNFFLGRARINYPAGIVR